MAQRRGAGHRLPAARRGRADPAQRTTAWFFLVISLLFFVQTLLGSAAEHYRADIFPFFGFDLAQVMAFNLARTWHLPLALFWTAAAFLAAGILLTPFVARREPQAARLSTCCWARSRCGGRQSDQRGPFHPRCLVGEGSPIFGQQWEYLDLPRV